MTNYYICSKCSKTAKNSSQKESSIEEEEKLLALLLTYPAAFSVIKDIVDRRDFSFHSTRTIFKTIYTLVKNKVIINNHIVAQIVSDKSRYQHTLCLIYLKRIQQSLKEIPQSKQPNIINVAHNVREKSILRKLFHSKY